MNKKNVYDELLGYRVKTDDVKPITDLFILLQDHEVNISLKDLLFFYNKKINLSRFKKLFTEALENNLEIPIDRLKEISLTGNDFLNLVDGIISAKKEGLEIKIDDMVYFAKMKINIPDLLKSLKKINTHDESIVLNDFAQCKNCLYESRSFINDLIELKKYSKEISLKQTIQLQFNKGEANIILSAYKQLESYNKVYSLKEIIDLKSQGFNISDLLNGMLLAEKKNISLEKHLIQKILPKNNSFESFIKDIFTPEKQIIKPVRVILKSGLEILLKIQFLFIAEPQNVADGMNKNATVTAIKKALAETAEDIENAKDFLKQSHAVSNGVQKSINDMKPAYSVHGLSIEDYIIGRHIPTEQDTMIWKSKADREIALQAYLKEHKRYKKIINTEHINSGKDTGH
jgi:uncharacterized protein YqfA (UPF0365 family)